MKPAPRFLFRGEAVGVAGHIRRPRDIVIPAQASVSLPIIGGLGVSAVNGGSFGGVVSFGSAIVTVHGDYDPPEKAVIYTEGNHGSNELPTRTTVTTEVRDLSIVSSNGRSRGHTLTVARLATTLESRHSRKLGPEPRFTTKPEIEGFKIDGHPFKIEFAEKLLAIETYEGLYTPPLVGRGVAKAAPGPRDAFAELFEPWPKTGRFAPAPGRHPEYEVCTACLKIQPIGRGRSPAEVLGPNRLHVKGFGTIYLAEMVLSPVDRRLALMRIELGSFIGGDLVIDASGLDGHTWPP